MQSTAQQLSCIVHISEMEVPTTLEQWNKIYNGYTPYSTPVICKTHLKSQFEVIIEIKKNINILQVKNSQLIYSPPAKQVQIFCFWAVLPTKFHPQKVFTGEF